MFSLLHAHMGPIWPICTDCKHLESSHHHQGSFCRFFLSVNFGATATSFAATRDTAPADRLITVPPIFAYPLCPLTYISSADSSHCFLHGSGGFQSFPCRDDDALASHECHRAPEAYVAKWIRTRHQARHPRTAPCFRPLWSPLVQQLLIAAHRPEGEGLLLCGRLKSESQRISQVIKGITC